MEFLSALAWAHLQRNSIPGLVQKLSTSYGLDRNLLRKLMFMRRSHSKYRSCEVIRPLVEGSQRGTSFFVTAKRIFFRKTRAHFARSAFLMQSIANRTKLAQITANALKYGLANATFESERSALDQVLASGCSSRDGVGQGFDSSFDSISFLLFNFMFLSIWVSHWFFAFLCRIVCVKRVFLPGRCIVSVQ